MGRLIDEDEVIKAVDKHTKDCSEIVLDNDISCILEEVPTAYDVGRVVERLEKERICLEDNYGDEVICIGAHDAVDIVKRGGIE